MKIVITLLLLAAVAGTVYDAYAQTNTERIRTIESTTAEIKATVDDIVASLSPISDIIEKIDNILLSSAALTSEVSDVKSSISGFNTALLAIQATAESNKNQLNGLTAHILEMSTKIDGIQDTLVGGGNAALEQRIDQLKTTVDNNNLALSTRLQNIEASLSVIGAQLETPTQTSSNLVRKSVNQDVTSYDYKVSGIKRTVSGDTVYFLDMKFSCDGVVSIDSVSTSVRTPQPPIIPTSSPNSHTNENYLKVDNRDLYNSKFEVSAGSFSILNRDVDFNLRQLNTGSSLDFSSRQVEDGTRIADSTSTSFAFSYVIEVVYLGSASTTCTLDTGRGSPSNTALSQTGTLLLHVDIPSPGVLNNFSETYDCKNNPVQITNIHGRAIGKNEVKWDPTLISFAKFNLEFPNDSGSNIQIGFNDDGTVSSTAYPISFSNSRMEVTGTLPKVPQLLVEIKYSTVPGGSCTSQ
ncbi:MAG: hypothetical protein F4202_04205 [Cenarchaeum sp. SB0677_bin_16]|nr:hypothetical protein [Cenarchaeum sp. SB0662_bin_33]MYG33184.1 hypothetical protein [Cenarchaeum sp. SB0677_bin_16]